MLGVLGVLKVLGVLRVLKVLRVLRVPKGAKGALRVLVHPRANDRMPNPQHPCTPSTLSTPSTPSTLHERPPYRRRLVLVLRVVLTQQILPVIVAVRGADDDVDVFARRF